MKTFMKDTLEVKIFDTRDEMGRVAAEDFKAALKKLLAEKETVRVIFAAAPSQNDLLKYIVADEEIDLSRVDAFHMDEYVGLDPKAPQAFGQFLRDRIFDLRKFHSVTFLDGTGDPKACAADYAKMLASAPVDIVCMGIGENGHIAFNDPGFALFDDPEDVKIVDLDDVCRMQQVHDGCFKTFDDVPKQALTLTVSRLMNARYHFCVVPAPTKAEAAKKMLEGEIAEACPCTILRRQPGAKLYLDKDSSALLSK